MELIPEEISLLLPFPLQCLVVSSYSSSLNKILAHTLYFQKMLPYIQMYNINQTIRMSYITEQYQVAYSNEKMSILLLWDLLKCFLTLLRGATYFIYTSFRPCSERDPGNNKHPDQLASFLLLLLAKFFVLYLPTVSDFLSLLSHLFEGCQD